MGWLIAAGALLFGFGTAYVASDDVRYLTRAGFEETRILAARTPIRVVARDTTQPLVVRHAAALVEDIRLSAGAFGLDPGETYTTYSDVGRDTLLLVLTASPRNCLCPVTWSYPFVGKVPYRGYFDPQQARAAADEYIRRNYDVHLRPSSAFSTLGWFNDPLLSTAISRDSVDLASLVFHEIAHNMLWVKHATDFNESFAQWAGYRAAEQFFTMRRDTVLAARTLRRWEDERTLGRYFGRLLGKLDSLYADRPTGDRLTQGRHAVEDWSRDTLTGPSRLILNTIDAGVLADRPINNAALLGVGLYRTNLELFDAWYHLNGRRIDLAVQGLREALDGVEGPEAWVRLRALVAPAPALPE
jgi:predicted aminopeptidase